MSRKQAKRAQNENAERWKGGNAKKERSKWSPIKRVEAENRTAEGQRQRCIKRGGRERREELRVSECERATSREQKPNDKDQRTKHEEPSSKEHRANSEEQRANNKEQTAKSEEPTANSKQQTANSKQQTAVSRQRRANSEE